jgi:hypothetical protein
MLVDAMCNLVQFPLEHRRQAKSSRDADRRELFGLTPGVGFKFPIEAAFQEVNLIEIPEPRGVENGIVVSLKEGLLEKLPNRKLEQWTHNNLWGLEDGRKAQVCQQRFAHLLKVPSQIAGDIAGIADFLKSIDRPRIGIFQDGSSVGTGLAPLRGDRSPLADCRFGRKCGSGSRWRPGMA